MPSKPQLSIVCVFDPVDGSKNPAKGREDNTVWSLQCHAVSFRVDPSYVNRRDPSQIQI